MPANEVERSNKSIRTPNRIAANLLTPSSETPAVLELGLAYNVLLEDVEEIHTVLTDLIKALKNSGVIK